MLSCKGIKHLVHKLLQIECQWLLSRKKLKVKINNNGGSKID